MEEPGKIKQIFMDFKDLIGKDSKCEVEPDRQTLYMGKSIDLGDLEQPFSMEEIKHAVFKVAKDKATGPDGYPANFVQHF